MMHVYEALMQALGVDRQEAEESFAGHLALYAKYLKAFPQDPCYGALCQAMARGDAQAVAAAAHGLKGVSSTLLLKEVLAPCVRILSLARAGSLTEAKTIMGELAAAYVKTLAAIEKYA